MTVSFENDDLAFSRWIDWNKKAGFVLNARLEHLAPYAVLHETGCPQIKFEGTGPTFVRVWADTTDDLRRWVSQHGKATLKVCPRCLENIPHHSLTLAERMARLGPTRNR